MGPEPVTREMQLWGCWPVLTDHKQTGGYVFTNCSGNTNLDNSCSSSTLSGARFLSGHLLAWLPLGLPAGKMRGWPHSFPRNTEPPFLLGNSPKKEVRSEMQPEEPTVPEDPAVPEAGADLEDIEFGLD